MTRSALIVVLSLIAPAAIASAQVPTVASLSQSAVSRGQTVEVSVTGKSLATVDNVGVADARGLDVSIVTAPPPAKDDQLKLRLTAAADATPGEREIRLLSPTGVSAPVRVAVEQLPAVAEVEPNNTPEQPQAISATPAVIVGKIDGAGDIDCFRVSAAKGQTLIVNVLASRVRSALDPTVILYNPTGKEVMANNDTFGPDSFLAYDIPADGNYTIELRDLQYRGGGNYDYRVEIGALPYLTAVEPMAGRKGQLIDLQLKGYNLTGIDKKRLDLTYAASGRIGIRAQSALGIYSNELPFEVTDLVPTVERESNDLPQTATPIAGVEADVTGVIERPGDVDFYKLTLPKRTTLNMEILGRRLSSPLDGLLTLHNAKGEPIDRNDDAAGADARISRALDPGEYYLSVRDLAFGGGPNYAYRLAIRQVASPLPNGPAQDFAVRFQPDTLQIHRGSATKVWCDVIRSGGFAGDVTVAVEDLPAGVTVTPVVMAPSSSGVISIVAAPDAALGSAPIRIRASGVAGGETVTRDGRPEVGGGMTVAQGYLTVLDVAPFNVTPVGALPPDRVNALAGEIGALVAKLSSQANQDDPKRVEWEKQIAAAPPWSTLKYLQTGSAERGTFKENEDGSLLATNPVPKGADTYNLVATTDVKGIVAIRLEALTDPALPNRGPGRPGNGNFVLNELRITASPKNEPTKAQPVKLKDARATFSQVNYPVANAIDGNPETGWAIFPEGGKNQSAVFFLEAPVGFEGGTIFNIAMEQRFGMDHLLGKFRFAVSTDPKAADGPSVPDAIRDIVMAPRDKRTPEQTAKLNEFYRSIDPTVAADRARLDVLRTVIAPYAEMKRLEELLKQQQTPELDAAQKQWEQSLADGAGWEPVDWSSIKSDAGAVLSKDADGTLFVSGNAAPKDTYTLSTKTKLKGITAIRIEALPDPRLPNNGPGRGGDGNFTLSGLKATLAPVMVSFGGKSGAGTAGVPDPNETKPPEPKPIEFASAKATFEPKDHGVALALDDKDDTGWSIDGQQGRPVSATFYVKSPAGAEDGEKLLTLTLAHQSPAAGQTLGRFRVLVTTSPLPDSIVFPPAPIAKALAKPMDKRDDAERREIAAYYRSIAPSLEPARQRLAELKAETPPFPVEASRRKASGIAVLLDRAKDFTGDVTVTLEGYQSGRENNGPAPIAKSLKVSPLDLKSGTTLGLLTFQVEQGAELGTKLAVLRAEGKVGDRTVVQYSPAFPVKVDGR